MATSFDKARHPLEELRKAQVLVTNFLEKNGFKAGAAGAANMKRGVWFKTTYLLHEAIKQDNPYIAAKLLMFGADPNRKNGWGQSAFDLLQKGGNKDMLKVFEQHLQRFPEAVSWKHKLQCCPPPRGYEEFFARVEQDPLVQVPSNESVWLLLLGRKCLRSTCT